jgi:hypothetical protein
VQLTTAMNRRRPADPSSSNATHSRPACSHQKRRRTGKLVTSTAEEQDQGAGSPASNGHQ